MRHGATDEEVESLIGFEEAGFSDAEKAAFAWSAALTRGDGHVDDALFERLSRFWSEGEIVEITEMAALFNYFNRIANALQIDPTAPGEGL